MSGWMSLVSGCPRRQVLVLDHHPAVRAVELDDAHPIWIEGVIERRVIADWLVYLARIPLVQQTAAFVRLPGRDQVAAAPVTAPELTYQIDVQVLSDPNAQRWLPPV